MPARVISRRMAIPFERNVDAVVSRLQHSRARSTETKFKEDLS